MKYRLLARGDIIQEGDEIYNPLSQKWEPRPQYVGREVSGIYQFRRIVKEGLGPIEKTQRGFEIIKFNDGYETGVLQDLLDGKVLLGDNRCPALLNKTQIKSLIAHLQAYLDTGSFNLDTNNKPK